MRERFWRPSSRTSSKPSVVRTAVTAPFCSSTALVATVVPWMKRPTSAGAAPARASTRRTAWAVPCRRSLGVRRDLGEASRPSWPRATMSVKVPPMSTPICTPGERVRHYLLRETPPPSCCLGRPFPPGGTLRRSSSDLRSSSSDLRRSPSARWRSARISRRRSRSSPRISRLPGSGLRSFGPWPATGTIYRPARPTSMYPRGYMRRGARCPERVRRPAVLSQSPLEPLS